MDGRESRLVNHWHPKLHGLFGLSTESGGGDVRVEGDVPSFRAGVGIDDSRLRQQQS